MKKCTLKILDNVNCVFVGITQTDIKLLWEQFAEYVPGYIFQAKYKFTDWDGKIHYFTKTGKTYVNLLHDILPEVQKLDYNIKLVDNREVLKFNQPDKVEADFFSNIIIPEENIPWIFRDYQLDVINTLLDNRGGVAVAGTGSGKTSICAAIAKSYEISNNYKSIIIVPDKSLNLQTYNDYLFFGLDVGQYYGDVKDTSKHHLVSTWQSLQNNPTLLKNYQVVIIDECHGLKAKVLSGLLNEQAGKHIVFRFGVTGTIPKEKTDAIAITIAVGEQVIEIPAHELIEREFLAKPHIDVLQHDMDLTKEYDEYKEEYNKESTIVLTKLKTYTQFKNSFFADWSDEKRYLQKNKERLQWIADYIDIQASKEKGNVLCLVDGISFGKRLTKLIPNAVFLYGDDDVEVRDKIYKLFQKNDNLRVIASSKIASTGINIKRIFHFMLIDIGKSFVKVIQGIGRSLRTAPDKSNVHVTDICSDFKISKRHLYQRLKYYKEAKYQYKKRKVKINR